MHACLRSLGLKPSLPGVFHGRWTGSGPWREKVSPVAGSVLGRVRTASAADYDQTIKRASRAFQAWSATPPPVRGETLRQLGLALRGAKNDLGCLISLE